MKRTIKVVIEVQGDGLFAADERREEIEYWATMTKDVLRNVTHNYDKACDRAANNNINYQPIDFTNISISQDPSPGDVCTNETCGQWCDESGGEFIRESGDVSHGDYTAAVAYECDCDHHGRVK